MVRSKQNGLHPSKETETTEPYPVKVLSIYKSGDPRHSGNLWPCNSSTFYIYVSWWMPGMALPMAKSWTPPKGKDREGIKMLSKGKVQASNGT